MNKEVPMTGSISFYCDDIVPFKNSDGTMSFLLVKKDITTQMFAIHQTVVGDLLERADLEEEGYYSPASPVCALQDSLMKNNQGHYMVYPSNCVNHMYYISPDFLTELDEN